MKAPFMTKMDSLDFKLSEDCQKPTEELITSFENEFDVKLPADYRAFLKVHGGKIGEATCKFKEPTPMGSDSLINTFYGFSDASYEDIISMTDLIDGYPVVIAIGSDGLGSMFWLMCQGPSTGAVLLHDHENRSSWSDEKFYSMFSNLAPEIKDYLEMRKSGVLPHKDEGLEDIYKVANSFTEFINNLEEITVESDDLDILIPHYLEKGQLNEIEDVINKGLSVNYILKDGWDISILELAVIESQSEIIEYLISKGADTQNAYELACKNTESQPKVYAPVKELIERIIQQS